MRNEEGCGVLWVKNGKLGSNRVDTIEFGLWN